MAGKMALNITRFSRFGVNLGRLTVYEAEHIEALDGTDELNITCAEDINKGEYLVWQDRTGAWHEHIVDEPTRGHDASGRPLTTATCIGSIAETWDDWVDDKRPNGSAQRALDAILENSRWTSGVCTQEGTNSHTFYHTSVREALSALLKVWGGEMAVSIATDGSKVTERTVAIVARRGDQNSAKRFTWSKDLIAISRTINSSNVKTRIYAYGKGEAIDATGGFGRRIGIESVNDGVPYIEDEAATEQWGRYDASGNLMPSVGVFIDQECEDPALLLEEATAYLWQIREPTVTYEADVLDLAAFGREWEGIGLGDTVSIIDEELCDGGLRLRGRISKVKRDLLTNDTEVTFGTLVDALGDPWTQITSNLGYLSDKAATWSQTAEPTSSWLDTFMASLNARYNAAGTYHYTSYTQGDIWSSVPLDENGHATEPGGWAMNINGMGFRLASNLNEDGSWDWRTFGNGEGFTADEIVAGIIKGGNSYWNLSTGDLMLNNGTISAADGSSYWNLDTGEFFIGSGAHVDGMDELQDAVADAATKDELNNLANSVVSNDDTRMAWIRMTTVGGEPALMMGESETDFNSKLTNTGLGMYEGDELLAMYGGEDGMTVPKASIGEATVTDNLSIGNWAWVPRSNGNLALKWIG